MDREKWLATIRADCFPAWPCPYCAPGTLTIRKNTLRSAETPESIAGRENPGWDPDWITETFIAELLCNNAACPGVVHVVGVTSWTMEIDYEEGTQDYIPIRDPRYVHPALRMIEIPDEVPEEIVTLARAAFAAYWSDADSSANRIRAAVEALLTTQGVPRFYNAKIRGKGTRLRYTLNKRIQKYKAAEPEIAGRLHAIRWLANPASHEVALSRSDVIDGLEILEAVLDEVFGKRKEGLERLVREINRRKKPRGRSTRRKP